MTNILLAKTRVAVGVVWGYEWNVMPRIRRGSNFVFFATLYCSCLEFTALLASPRYEGLQ